MGKNNKKNKAKKKAAAAQNNKDTTVKEVANTAEEKAVEEVASVEEEENSGPASAERNESDPIALEGKSEVKAEEGSESQDVDELKEEVEAQAQVSYYLLTRNSSCIGYFCNM